MGWDIVYWQKYQALHGTKPFESDLWHLWKNQAGQDNLPYNNYIKRLINLKIINNVHLLQYYWGNVQYLRHYFVYFHFFVNIKLCILELHSFPNREIVTTFSWYLDTRYFGVPSNSFRLYHKGQSVSVMAHKPIDLQLWNFVCRRFVSRGSKNIFDFVLLLLNILIEEKFFFIFS